LWFSAFRFQTAVKESDGESVLSSGPTNLCPQTCTAHCVNQRQRQQHTGTTLIQRHKPHTTAAAALLYRKLYAQNGHVSTIDQGKSVS